MANKTSEKLNLNKYSRHLSLPFMGITGLNKIRDSKIIIVGAGALAHNCCQYLASSGVGELIIYDNDIIEESNLPRQILFSNFDLGKHKVTILAKYLKQHFPETKITIFNQRFESKLKQINKKNFSIIINASDNYTTRREINTFALKNNITWIDMGVTQMAGHVALYRPSLGCFECLFPNIASQNQACSIAGVLPSVCGAIGSIVVNEVMKYLTIPKENKINYYLNFDFFENNFKKYYWTKNQDCKHCQNNKETAHLKIKKDFSYFLDSKKIAEDHKNNFVVIDFNSTNLQNFNPEELYLAIIHEKTDLIRKLLDNINISQKNKVLLTCKLGIKSKISCEYLRSLGYQAYYSIHI